MHAHATSLWYRYFFYGWLFRDACHGPFIERSAAWRHNRAQAHWLPTYMRRWACLGALLFGVALACELALSSPTLSAFFYLPGVLTIPFNAVTALCWAWLSFAGR